MDLSEDITWERRAFVKEDRYRQTGLKPVFYVINEPCSWSH
jgi:hypothetical protein